MLEIGSICVYFTLNEEAKRKIEKLVEECKKTKVKCAKCRGMIFVKHYDSYNNIQVLCVVYEQDPLPALSCLKEKIKEFESIIRSCAIDIELEHGFTFDKLKREVLDFVRDLEKKIKNMLINEGLDCRFVYIDSNYYEVFVCFSKFDVDEILKAIDRINKIDLNMIVLQEVI